MKLIIEDDEGRKTVVPVLRDEITIGRNEQNLVRLAEKNVSRRHGRLLREEGNYYIEDLNSFTGIRVNGEKVEGKRLIHEGDLIQISEYDLILMPGPEEQRPKLVGISGKYRGEELVLDRSPIRLGRSDENDLQIEHPSISREHLRLHLHNGTWKVMDAESRNGVRVNGESYAQIGLR